MAAREALAARLDHKMLWPREKRWPLRFDQRMLWPREKRWPLRFDQRMLWPREKRWLLDLITKRYGRARSAGCLTWSQDVMAAREALAAQIDHKMLWPREKRWPLRLITKRC